MARFTDELQGLDENFQRRVPSYMSQDVHETEYEEFGVGSGNVQPVGFIGDEVITAESIKPGALADLDLYSDTIRPPSVVDTLPTLADASYPEGSLVFLTTDGKLYRNISDAWSTAVDGEDITANSITAGQIAAGAIGTTELAADAVIANVANVGGTVTIDDTGITIDDGALIFLDDFGETVLTGAGFGATWLDFLNSMVYNSRFAAGSTTVITAVTEVNGGNSDADYAASLSDDLPYWVVATESGAGSLKRVADTDAPSGFALHWLGDEDGEIYQDIPITPGQLYGVFLTWKYTNSSSSFNSIVGCQFLDKDHAEISGVPNLEESLLVSTSQSTYTTQWMNSSNLSDNKARYLRVRIQMQRQSGSPIVDVAAVNVIPTVNYGSSRVIRGSTSYDNGYGIAWWGGATVDVAMVRVGTRNVEIKDPLGFGLAALTTGILTLDSEGSFIRMDVKGQGTGNVASPPSGALSIFGLRAAGKDSLRVVWSDGSVSIIATQP